MRALVALLLLSSSGCALTVGHEKPYLKESNSEEVVMYGCEFKGWRASFLIPLPPTCLYQDSREAK